jgi:hypothetical protein
MFPGWEQVFCYVIAKRHGPARQQSTDGTCLEIRQEYFQITQEYFQIIQEYFQIELRQKIFDSFQASLERYSNKNV